MKNILSCLLTAAVYAAAPLALAQTPEAGLLAVLKSDAPQEQKADACRELGRVGTQASVAPLAALLGDEKLAHMARYGLETIPDPAVDAALRAALGQLKGQLLVGVINSLGVRRDATAVEPLTKLLADADAGVAAAAAMSLGKIGTPQAAAALLPALGKVPAAAEGLLRCAEALPDQAVALYDAVRAAQVPRHLKMAATRGAILARGAAGLPLLLEQLKREDAAMFSVALRVGRELPGADVTQALAAELGKVPAGKQNLLIQILGDRRDAAAAPALLAIAGSGAAEVRVAAIRALTQLGSAAAVPVLADLAASGDPEVAKAALSGLAGFPGQDVNTAIVALVNKPDAKLRCLGIELIGRRRITGALAEVLRLANDADPQVCGASFKVLGELAGANEIPALLALLQKTPATQAAEDALAAACARQALGAPGALVIQKAVYGALPDGPSADVTALVAELVKSGHLAIEASNNTFKDPAGGLVKSLRVDYTVNGIAKSATARENDTLQLDASTAVSPNAGPLLAAYAQAQGAPKLALLRLLRAAGGAQALATVRAATDDANADIKETALRALCDWPTAEAIPDLEKLAQSAPDPKFKILALRGYIRLLPLQNIPAAAKVAALQQAFTAAGRDEERRLVLASLGTVIAPEALTAAAAYLDNAQLKEEACLAAVAIAEDLVQTQPEPVADVLKKVIKAGRNADLLKRARKVMAQARKATTEDGFVPMFNGKDLTGWDGKPGWWTVADGTLLCESTPEKPCAKCNYLIWKGGQPGDFEMRAEIRLSEHANSGIQIRSEVRPDWDTYGYQADMTGDGKLAGFIYHHKLGLVAARGQSVSIDADGRKTIQTLGTPAELLKYFKKDDWNRYRVVCHGAEIVVYLNGVMMCQISDLTAQAARTGIIALQMHPGPPMKIQFRNLRIKVSK